MTRAITAVLGLAVLVLALPLVGLGAAAVVVARCGVALSDAVGEVLGGEL